MIREISKIADPVLNSLCTEVTNFNSGLKQLVADMTETMLAASGIGLAANQIYIPLRIFTYLYLIEEKQKAYPSYIINPVILYKSEDEQIEEEGCLSVNTKSHNKFLIAKCKRSKKIIVKGQDLKGKSKILYGEGLLASCIQHEIDHLNGRFYLSRIKQDKEKLKNLDSVILGWYKQDKKS